MKNNIRYEGSINNTSVIIFSIRSWLDKTPSDCTCLGEPPGGFCDVGCCCCFLPHWRFFHFIAFRRHPSPFSDYTHFILSAQLIAIITFLGFSFLPRVLRFWVGAFYPTLLRLWLRCGHEHPPHPGSSSVPALTELSLPVVAWTWTIDVWSTRPLIYQLRQWATKYRVKIELLNIFRLFKVMFKDY